MHTVIIPITDFLESAKEHILEDPSIVERLAVRTIIETAGERYAHGLKVFVTERENIKLSFSRDLIDKWEFEMYQVTGLHKSSNDTTIIHWFSSHINNKLSKEGYITSIKKETKTEIKEEPVTVENELKNINNTLKEILTILKEKK